MAGFYIKRLVVTGKDKEPSDIDFTEGLNIVCGPSDTGKSYIIECIDYIFGGEDIPIEGDTGYDCVTMTVKTEYGTVTVERVFGTNRLKVSSSDNRVASGSYNTERGKRNANTDLWLKLIGIEGHHTIIKNKSFAKNNLTWRYFLHMFLIKEETIIQKPSILLPQQKTAETGALSSLLFLITGRDFADSSPQVEKKIRIAKKDAVASYIDERLKSFAKRKAELDEAAINGSIDISKQVEGIIEEIAATEKLITNAYRRNKQLLTEIFAYNEHLTECNTLLNRYRLLKTQYDSDDVKRLSLIAVGDYHSAKYPINAKCPFCDSEIKVTENASYIEPTHGTLHTLQAQKRDLAVSEKDLQAENAEIENQIATLNAEKLEVSGLLNKELKPRAASLRQSLAEYRKTMEVQDELNFIRQLEVNMKSEQFKVKMEDDSNNIEFNIKSHFDRDILDRFDHYIESVLRSCKYDNFNSARLLLGKFDVLVNEKRVKRSFGKGYRAFLNTALALALQEYLSSDECKYSPRLLFVDSPILSLKEKVDDEASDSMKAALFRYLRDRQDSGQVIVIENEIPELDYGDTNIVRFTKDEAEGRYGFLYDVR